MLDKYIVTMLVMMGVAMLGSVVVFSRLDDTASTGEEAANSRRTAI